MFKWKNEMSKQAVPVRAMKQDPQSEEKNVWTFVNKLHAPMCYSKNCQKHWDVEETFSVHL